MVEVDKSNSLYSNIVVQQGTQCRTRSPRTTLVYLNEAADERRIGERKGRRETKQKYRHKAVCGRQVCVYEKKLVFVCLAGS